MRRTVFALAVAATVLVAGCTGHPAATARPTTGSPASVPSAGTASPAAGGSPDDAVWAAGRSTPVADPMYPKHGTAGLDVLHYDLALSWEPRTRVLRGKATLRIRPTLDAARLSLDFMPYTLDGVTVDGQARQARVAGEKLVVDAPVSRDRTLTLTVGYHGRPRTTPMPSHRSDIEALGLTVTKDGSLWTMQEPYGAFTWYPANDQPSDKALYDIAVTVPAGWTAIAGGTPAGVTGNTYRYRSADPVASYLTTLAVGHYRKISATGPHGLPLTYWVRPGADDRLLPVLRESPKLLAFLEKRFGRYPFPSAGAVVVPSKSAMETQQMVTMGSGAWHGRDPRRGFESDLLHEYAHQWFGDTVTPATWRDVWLNEGWAMYVQLLFEQQRDHFTDADLWRWLRQVDAKIRRKQGPPGRPKAGDFADDNVYICPAAMLYKLHHTLGDARFSALGRDWIQQHRNSQQDRASFIAFVNQRTGRDFTKMLNAWLLSQTTPR